MTERDLEGMLSGVVMVGGAFISVVAVEYTLFRLFGMGWMIIIMIVCGFGGSFVGWLILRHRRLARERNQRKMGVPY